MADGNNDTTIRIGLDADLSGGVQTEKQLDGLKNKAAQLGKDGSSSVGKVTGAVGGLQKACGLLRNVLTGFGVVGVFSMLASAVGKVKDSFGAAKKEADELAKAKDKAAHKEAVEALAKSYEQLGESMRTASEAMQRANELEDIATRNARALEDAQLDLAKQKELAAIDPNDPAAAEKRAQIEADYAARRGHLTADRSREDLDRERNRLQAAASAKRNEAADIEALTKNDDKLIKDVKRRLAAATAAAGSPNDEDYQGFWGNLGGITKNAVTLNWGSIGDSRTEKGDALRAEAKAEAERLKAELKDLEEKRAKRLQQAADIRAEGEQMQQKSYELQSGYKVIDVREQATGVETSRGVIEADNALDKKNKEIAKKAAQKAKDAATVQEGPGRIAAIQRQIDAAEAQRRAAQESDAREQEDAVMARLALENFNNGEGRRGGTGTRARRSELEADVERETREAASSRIQLQGTLATLATTLKGLNSDLAKVKREVDAAVKRQNNINAEAPEG